VGRKEDILLYSLILRSGKILTFEWDSLQGWWMMRWALAAVALCASGMLIAQPAGCLHAESKKEGVPITKDFCKAKQLARAYNKPLALVFTGSDWCLYSRKLLEDILGSKEFAQEIKQTFFFANIDFPELHSHLDVDRVESNYHLKKQFQVKEFPLIVLLDEEMHEVTRMGFSGHTSSEYGRRLVEDWKLYQTIKKALEAKPSLSFSELRRQYILARELGSSTLVEQALHLGLKQDQECFFHLEKYRLAKGEERKEWKKRILALNQDKKNRVGLHLAVLEYQERQEAHQDNALAPLLDYVKNLESYSSGYQEGWRVHMLIAQQLALDGDVASALHHAKASLKVAPEEHRYEIEHSIKILSADLLAHEERDVTIRAKS